MNSASLKSLLKNVIEDNSSKKGRRFDYFIQILIFLSLISFALETLPGLSTSQKYGLEIFEICCVMVFTIEYLLRIWVAKDPLKYIFSFYGIIDLLAILPFFLSRTWDFRVLRSFRVFRIFRALKLIRYNRALQRFHLATKIVKEEIVLFFIVTMIFIYLTSCGIYYFEHEAQPEIFKSVFHSLWWSIVTLTTVGYGDVYPITVGGKVFTFFVVIIGVGIVTVPAGLVASSLSKAREIEDEKFHLKNKN